MRSPDAMMPVGKRRIVAKRPTIYSIAKDLGLSAATVSRAFSRPELVRPEVRLRILERAREVDYQINVGARGLTTGQTGMVGLVIPDIENPFFAPLISAVQVAADAQGLTVLLIDSQRDAAAEPTVVEKVRTRVDGLILVSSRRATGDLIAALGGVPHVLVNRRYPESTSVAIDNTEALRSAGDHLAALGHRKFALLRGPRQSWAADQRTCAVRTWTREKSHEIVEIGPLEAQFEGGVEAASMIHASGATAVFAFDDLMACGVIAGLAELAVSVPGDISVVGCDDVLLARAVTPALTTIRAPFGAVATSAIGGLISVWAGGTPLGELALSGELILRASTGPAPSGPVGG